MDRRAVLRAGTLLGIALVASPMIGVLQGCTTEGEPPFIAIGRDACAFCRMTVSETRFASALVTAKGRTLVFDSVECLASYCAKAGHEHSAPARALWVSAGEKPREMIPAERAFFARVADGSSPMGKGLVAERALRTNSLTWSQVLALVEREGLQRGSAPPAASAT